MGDWGIGRLGDWEIGGLGNWGIGGLGGKGQRALDGGGDEDGLGVWTFLCLRCRVLKGVNRRRGEGLCQGGDDGGFNVSGMAEADFAFGGMDIHVHFGWRYVDEEED